jgi:hypothetical protein
MSQSDHIHNPEGAFKRVKDITVGLARWSQQWQGSCVGFSIAIFGVVQPVGERERLSGPAWQEGVWEQGQGGLLCRGGLAGEPLGCLWVKGGSESRWAIVVQLWGGRGGKVRGVGAWYIKGWVLHTSRDSRRGWGRGVCAKLGGDGRAQESQATQS